MAIQTQEQFIRELGQVVSRLNRNLFGARVTDAAARGIIAAVKAQIYEYLQYAAPGNGYFFLREGGIDAKLRIDEAIELIDVSYDHLTQSLNVNPSRMVNRVLWDQGSPLTTIRIDGRTVGRVGRLGQMSRSSDQADAMSYALTAQQNDDHIRRARDAALRSMGAPPEMFEGVDVPPIGRARNQDITQILLERQAQATMTEEDRRFQQEMNRQSERLRQGMSAGFVEALRERQRAESEDFSGFEVSNIDQRSSTPVPTQQDLEQVLRDAQRMMDYASRDDVRAAISQPVVYDVNTNTWSAQEPRVAAHPNPGSRPHTPAKPEKPARTLDFEPCRKIEI